ncbi:DUF2254 domain-containing protein [Thalassoroseus pseudoceratinae]|uniref:DUF2254 domain-containing protein n=1 Tax=Thalassoroseus pseudoceratinae TaxID=2713176 RepID=UPI0014210E40|nr:DUF2254 domain-containing protein [Thalassoroseus pseudoceratinae]
MRLWLLRVWEQLRGSFWFVPTAMMFATGAMAFTLCELDSSLATSGTEYWEWLVTSADSARSTLSLLSGTMITLAGVVFSLTMVTLSLTSSQFGSRLLRTVITDLTTQFGLGAFLATALYCLIVQRYIPAVEESPFVPHLSVSVASGFALTSLAVMIGFVHHVSVAIQAQTVVMEAASELDGVIERFFPEPEPEPLEEQSPVETTALMNTATSTDHVLRSDAEGYLQAIDLEALQKTACEMNVTLVLGQQLGGFVLRDSVLLHILHREDAENGDKDRWEIDESVKNRLSSFFMIGRDRTPHQDICCAIDNVVEIALRALSPGINDPFTAVTCVDRLSASLVRLTRRRFPLPCRQDEDGSPRILFQQVQFPELLRQAFQPIRHDGAMSLMVARRLMIGLDRVSQSVFRGADCREIVRQTKCLLADVQRLHPLPEDREEIEAAGQAILARHDDAPGL